MTTGEEFLTALEARGVTFLSGVPCSYFAAPLRLLADHERVSYVPAVNEGSALAIAAGARLAGVPAGVLIQNSGLGNLINPLTSLVLPYSIPLLVLMSMRGYPTAGPGEPQHRLMGRVSTTWLDSMDLPYWHFEREGMPFVELMAEVSKTLESGRTCFVLVGKNAIEPPGPLAEPTGEGRVLRDDLVRALAAELRDEAVVSTTGYLSRAMFGAGDRPTNLYMQGSMGHAAGLAFGAALQRPDRRFVVLDGDGSMLMHLGGVATIGRYAPRNLVHIVFDNGAYESTGAQPTATSVDFAVVAEAAGYRHALLVENTADLTAAVRAALALTGPIMLVVRGTVGGPAGDRASESMDVTAMAGRFTAAVTGRRPA
ncbi:phosphonopyruvate decarboxylase [Micromonospora sp. WMMD1120]|uniref:phosphonopyruvate decarboxylase n=1 Tax=Micromonospora sp. WMMD1120 TaxID=3016106 RepID=UPI002416B579|nr:phosphonopyruvate decarboxylase [Micromonospora sp. WMMD1120]MDG4810868.1 phosphonopyruvate decarboxylase [Micromonospora sp. WMMD1120]